MDFQWDHYKAIYARRLFIMLHQHIKHNKWLCVSIQSNEILKFIMINNGKLSPDNSNEIVKINNRHSYLPAFCSALTLYHEYPEHFPVFLSPTIESPFECIQSWWLRMEWNTKHIESTSRLWIDMAKLHKESDTNKKTLKSLRKNWFCYI